MSPRKFLVLAFFFLLLAAASFSFRAPTLRLGVFTLLGCLSCAGLAAAKLMSLTRATGKKVGDELVEFKVQNVPTDGYLWAGSVMPFSEACKHFITVGSSGAGKSITLNLLMQSVFCRFGRDDGVRRRAVVYDAKADLVGFLAGILPMQKLAILNPFDNRFRPWNIAKDITTETDAIEFASILLPKTERDSSPYFANAARALIAGVITRFNATTIEGQFWTFRDLILAFHTKQRLQSILRHPTTAHLQDHFKEDNAKNFAGVKSTADTDLALYRPIAAFFASANEAPISLKEWLNGDGTVLVLGNHESAREATDTLNRLIFRQLSKFIIGRSGKPEKDETWIFLDELREMGALPGLRQLLLRGRSKGVAIATGFQDVEGMYAAYGEHEGQEIIGAAQNAAILHVNATAPKTAEWASRVFSSRRDVASSSSMSIGEQYSQGTSSHMELVPNVFPIQFVSLPMPKAGGGVNYFGFTDKLGYGHGRYPWAWLNAQGPFSVESGNQPDFIGQKDDATDMLKPWNLEDTQRLGLQNISLDEAAPAPPPPNKPDAPSDSISELLR